MRNLLDIVEDVKRGGKPDVEELRYALLAYQAMFTIDHKNLLEALTTEKPYPEFLRKLKAENSFNMVKNALNKSPKEWLGWNNDPDNPEYQYRIDLAEKIFEKVTGVKL